MAAARKIAAAALLTARSNNVATGLLRAGAARPREASHTALEAKLRSLEADRGAAASTDRFARVGG